MNLRAVLITVILSGMLAACVMNSPMPPAPVSSTVEESLPAPAAPSANQYLVQKGDTLYSIGKKLGISYLKLAEINQLTAPYPIHVGQLLNLNGKSTNTAGTRSASETLPAATDDAEVVIAPISQPDINHSVENTVSTESATNKPANESSKTNPLTEFENIADADIQWQWPLKGKVLAGFDPQTNKGINMTGQPGQAVAAAGAGKVIYSGLDVRGSGKLIIIKHNSNLLSVYAHQGNTLVKEGTYIAQGEKVAILPTSGPQPSMTLHFEIRKKGKPVDPSTYLQGSNS